MKIVKKVIVIGLDGFEPKIAEPMMDAGELPALAALRRQGSYTRVATTYPAQTPVAWSTFATGANPGGHGIFDFIRRDPKTYLPDLSLNRYEQKNAFVAPKAVNLRRGKPVWELLSAAGIPSTVLRCPCTYPPDTLRGRMLAGMGVPDLRGGLGTSTFYSTQDGLEAQESEAIVRIQPEADGVIRTHLLGPRNPKTRTHFTCDISLHPKQGSDKVVLHSDGQPRDLELHLGRWSGWLKVRFKTGLLQGVHGMVRFYLPRVEPVFELYASPINFDPDAPLFPLSSPPGYAKELAAEVGTFYTTGMVEDHGGLNNGRFDEAAYLEQCRGVLAEREKMMLFELARREEGLFFCLFDTPDRVQHMFWRFREPEHPANAVNPRSEMARVIEEHYRSCDSIVAAAAESADDQTLFVVLSDHGFNSFRRGIHLNTWLVDQGLMVLKDGARTGAEAGDFFRHVDWPRTKAYALGLGGMYLNLKGREGQGSVEPADASAVAATIAKGLTGMVDPAGGKTAIRSVLPRAEVYRGPYANESPDLLVNCGEGFRSSWETALGGIPEGHFADNVKRWSGDHIIDPALVPGILVSNRALQPGSPALVDLAPTILAALGVEKGSAMEGKSLLA